MYFLKIRSLKYKIKIEKSLQIVDLIEIFEMNNKIKKKSLNFIAEFLEIKTKPFSGYKIPEFWENKKYEEIKNYIKEEIEILAKIVEIIKNCGFLNL